MKVEKLPFPWYGGKSKAAHLIWERLGNPNRYIEPFFGGGAVLFNRPTPPKGLEIVNDINAYIANFFRAVKACPSKVAEWASDPVNEADLFARHNWLIKNAQDLSDKIRESPDYFDVKIAGWWVWGISLWIGPGWCNPKNYNVRTLCVSNKRGIHTIADKRSYLQQISNRLKDVVIACGSWDRVLTKPVIRDHGTVGILLDPPYPEGYEWYTEVNSVYHEVVQWAIQHGDDHHLRIALCGYDADMPDSWECVSWTARGGFNNQSESNQNRFREKIWFSPHCLRLDLFS